MGRRLALTVLLSGCTFRVAPAPLFVTADDLAVDVLPDLTAPTSDLTVLSDLTSPPPDLAESPDLTLTPILTVTRAASPGSTNLTSEGVLDWAHYGLNMGSDVNHKAGITPLIVHAYTGTPQFYWAFGAMFTWTDGTPNMSITDTNNGAYTAGTNNGVSWVVPANTTQRTLRVYVGEYRGTGTLSARFTDGSIPDVVATDTNAGGVTLSRFTIVFRATQATQLSVTWKLTNDNGAGLADILAATLF
jgi:hypothetical protein